MKYEIQEHLPNIDIPHESITIHSSQVRPHSGHDKPWSPQRIIQSRYRSIINHPDVYRSFGNSEEPSKPLNSPFLHVFTFFPDLIQLVENFGFGFAIAGLRPDPSLWSKLEGRGYTISDGSYILFRPAPKQRP